jgi:AbrB family looped-hinge helix DNA binding protein
MTITAVSKMTSKNQITVPTAVREALCLDKGDALAFEIGDEGVITVHKSVPLDGPFTGALHPLLAEWDSTDDDEAYRDL